MHCCCCPNWEAPSPESPVSHPTQVSAGLQSMLLHHKSCPAAALNSLPAPTSLIGISHVKRGASQCLLGLLHQLTQVPLPGLASCMLHYTDVKTLLITTFPSPCRLVSPDILRLVHNSARMVYVGKQRGYHTRTQTEVRTHLSQKVPQLRAFWLHGSRHLPFGA